MEKSIGISNFLAQADGVALGVAAMLVLLSVASWTVIGARAVAHLRLRRCLAEALAGFWEAPDLDRAVATITASDRSGLFAGLAEASIRTLRAHERHESHGIGSGVTASEALTRALRSYMVHAQASIDGGLTFLASVGSTAPFIGLFGTVWGIYHALLGLSGASRVVLDKVAGPVGEALIMTAAGLFVAIPAVLAYNAFNRANRLVLAHLDGFAHDLHAFLAGGMRLDGRGQGGAR